MRIGYPQIDYARLQRNVLRFSFTKIYTESEIYDTRSEYRTPCERGQLTHDDDDFLFVRGTFAFAS